MFKKRSQQKVIRRRTEVDDDDEEEEENEAEQSTAASTLTIKVHTNEKLNKKNKSKKQNREKPKKTSLLSFGGDEEENEEEAVVIKKSSRSRKIANKIKKMNLEDKKRPKPPPPPQPKDEKPLPVPDSFDEDIAEEVTGMVEAPEVEIADLGTAGIIPDASIIHKARKQREMMRKFGSEFIPTAERTTTKLKSATTTSSSARSRMVREDDNDGSSDEGGAMQMRGLIRNDEGKSKKNTVVVDHEDEEVDRWEQELMRKGRFNKNNPPPPPQQQHKYPTYSDYQAMFVPPEPVKVEEPKKLAEPVTIAMVQDRLRSHLEALKKTNAAQRKEMESVMEDKRECEEMGVHLKDTKSLSEEYKFYQEVRQYVLNLIGCLRDKLRRVQALEKSMGELWRVQARKVSVRRSKDMQDEAAQVNNMAPDKNTPEGRDHQMRVVEREARRGQRERKRQKLRTVHHEGMSTDDEDAPTDRARYSSELARVMKEREAMFDDVIAEFNSIEAVLGKFKEWRGEHPSSYHDAFIALCVPRLVVPFVRHQLVGWNPLRGDSMQDWEASGWYLAVTKFALGEWEGGEDTPEDVKIVSSVVEKTVFARVCSLVSDVWNPLSTSQTRRLDFQLRLLTTGYPFMHHRNAACQQLAMRMCKSVQTCLGNDVYIPFIGAQATPQAIRYFERQSWSAIKLFRNVLILSHVLSFEAVRELAFDALLNRYVMLALQTSAMDVRSLAKCSFIVSSIPDSVLTHPQAPPLLKPLAGFLRCFRDAVAKRDAAAATKKMEEKLNALLMRLDKPEDSV